MVVCFRHFLQWIYRVLANEVGNQLSLMYNNIVLSYCITVVEYCYWVVVFAELSLVYRLWALLMYCYKHCGLADHSVVENVN